MSKLLFIGGFPSGGTDLTKTILNAHPEIYINGEMPFLFYLSKFGYNYHSKFKTIEEINKFKKLLKKFDVWNNLENINYDFSKDFKKYKSININYLLRIMFSSYNSKIWGNKTPQNSENIDNLMKIFPDAYFLIVIRDVRDICLSWNKKWGRNIFLCSHRYSNRMKKAIEFSKIIEPNHILFIKFENLLTKTDYTTKKITNFLDIQWSSKMLEHYKFTNKIIDGKINYGKKINPNTKNKWKKKLSPRKVKKIEEIAFNTMKLLDYETMYATRYKNLNLIMKLHGYLHELFCILFIGNKFSKKNTFNYRLNDIVFEVKKRIYKLRII